MSFTAANFVWLNNPSVTYGANSPIALTDLRKVAYFDLLFVAIEFAGNTPANTINLKVQWFNADKIFIFAETLLTANTATYNDGNTFSVKGAYASLFIEGSINPTFSASVQAILKQV